MKYVFLLYCLLVSNILRADLAYMPLHFELTSASPEYEEGDIMTFVLRITNTDKDSSYPVMMPNATNHGRKLLYMTAYTVDNKGFYTEVARENNSDPNSPSPSGSSSGNVYVVQLKPGAHVDLLIKMHPWYHYEHNSVDRHWFPKPLVAGEYQLLVWYQPYGIAPFDLYNYPEMMNGENSNTKLNIDKRGIQSNYCKVTITPLDTTKLKYGVAETCTANCKFCQHIADGNWNRVRKDIDATLKAIYARPRPIDTTATKDISWLHQHKNIIHLSNPPEVMILPFPSYWTQTIGFRHDRSLGGVKYFKMTFQMGKIYKSRSRIQSMVYWLGSNKQLLTTTDEDYIGISAFTEYDMLHGW